MGLRGPIIETKFTIPWKFSPIQVKFWKHMFSSMKMEDYMRSELFCIFWVKLVAKNIVPDFLGTQHRAASAVWCLFLKKYTNFLNQTVLNQTVQHSVFLVKQYFNSIYVKEKSFCLFNRAFLFVGPRGRISCSNVAKIFHAYEGYSPSQFMKY